MLLQLCLPWFRNHMHVTVNFAMLNQNLICTCEQSPNISFLHVRPLPAPTWRRLPTEAFPSPGSQLYSFAVNRWTLNPIMFHEQFCLCICIDMVDSRISKVCQFILVAYGLAFMFDHFLLMASFMTLADVSNETPQHFCILCALMDWMFSFHMAERRCETPESRYKPDWSMIRALYQSNKSNA